LRAVELSATPYDGGVAAKRYEQEGGSMPQVKRFGIVLSFQVSPPLAERLERIAPTATGQRSEFIRQALLGALDRAEREAEQARGDAA
jgi:hypothetical protein